MDFNSYIEYFQNWIKRKVKKAKANGVIVCLSGGIDSSLMSVIAKNFFPKKYLILLLPCIDNYQNDKNYQDSLELVKLFNLNYKILNLKKLYDFYLDFFKNLNFDNFKLSKITKGNIKARLRMLIAYTLANDLNYLVLGTSNQAEWYLGYFTKYGDSACDLAPLLNFQKSEIRSMAKFFQLPDKIINKEPSADLWDNQSDEKEWGFNYQELELFFQKKLVKKEIENLILTRHKTTFHKRIFPDKPINYQKWLEKNKKIN